MTTKTTEGLLLNTMDFLYVRQRVAEALFIDQGIIHQHITVEPDHLATAERLLFNGVIDTEKILFERQDQKS